MGSFTRSDHEGRAREPNLKMPGDQESPVQVRESCRKQYCLHFIVTNNLHQPIGRLKPSVSDLLSEDSTPKNVNLLIGFSLNFKQQYRNHGIVSFSLFLPLIFHYSVVPSLWHLQAPLSNQNYIRRQGSRNEGIQSLLKRDSLVKKKTKKLITVWDVEWSSWRR